MPNDPQNITAVVLTIWRFTWMRRKLSNSKYRRLTGRFSVISHLLLQQHKYRQKMLKIKDMYKAKVCSYNISGQKYIVLLYSMYIDTTCAIDMKNHTWILSISWLLLHGPGLLCRHMPEQFIVHCIVATKESSCTRHLFKITGQNYASYNCRCAALLLYTVPLQHQCQFNVWNDDDDDDNDDDNGFHRTMVSDWWKTASNRQLMLPEPTNECWWESQAYVQLATTPTSNSPRSKNTCK